MRIGEYCDSMKTKKDDAKEWLNAAGFDKSFYQFLLVLLFIVIVCAALALLAFWAAGVFKPDPPIISGSMSNMGE
jgi:predicted permease